MHQELAIFDYVIAEMICFIFLFLPKTFILNTETAAGQCLKGWLFLKIFNSWCYSWKCIAKQNR